MLNNQDFTHDRTKYLGGSDIGAILGLSPYKTPLDVWLEKTGKHSYEIDNLPIRFGSFAESFVASEYALATGTILCEHPQAITHPAHPYLQGHIDRFVTTDPDSKLFKDDGSCTASHLLECKTASPFTQSQWGEAGSDEVPMSYLAQCHWYLCMTGLERCDLAVLFGNSDFRIYQIHRDAALESTLLEAAITFWQGHVLKDMPPDAKTIGDYQKLFAKEVPGKTLEATEQTRLLIDTVKEINTVIDAKEQELEQIKKMLMEQMQEAQELTYQGKVLVTWKRPKASVRFDSKRFEMEHPELFPLFQTPIQNSRRLVIKT
jgi:putative phage-type endonuclease